jgi:uncharacterized protein (TIGR03067 family)
MNVLPRIAIVATFVVQAEGIATERSVNQAIQGTWEVVSVVRDGKATTHDQHLNTLISFRDGEVATVVDGRRGPIGKYVIDAHSDPVRIQWSWVDTKRHFITGIISTEGGVLTICQKYCDEKDVDLLRPQSFESTAENGCALYILSRRD